MNEQPEEPQTNPNPLKGLLLTAVAIPALLTISLGTTSCKEEDIINATKEANDAEAQTQTSTEAQALEDLTENLAFNEGTGFEDAPLEDTNSIEEVEETQEDEEATEGGIIDDTTDDDTDVDDETTDETTDDTTDDTTV